MNETSRFRIRLTKIRIHSFCQKPEKIQHNKMHKHRK